MVSPDLVIGAEAGKQMNSSVHVVIIVVIKNMLCQGSLSKGDLSNEAVADHCLYNAPQLSTHTNHSCTLDCTHKFTQQWVVHIGREIGSLLNRLLSVEM